MTRVVLNIGGVSFETEEATLQKYPETRLARECCGDKEHFYDRNPYIFSFILDMYRYDSLHLPRDICSSYLQAEIEFWEIPLDALKPCCFKALYGQDAGVNDIEFISKTFPHLSLCKRDDNSVPCKTTVLTIWKFVDDAKSSRQAMVSLSFHHPLSCIQLFRIYPVYR